MKFKKLLLYVIAFTCILTALPITSVQALTVEQLAADSSSIDVYFHDDGQDLTTLTTDDITATLDGNALTVESFKQAEQRINYMFLLDISRSVTEEYMTAAKQEILSIYQNLNEQDLLSVITFGDEVHTILDGTETLEEARTILDNVHCTNDYTHFYDAVNLMLERLEGTSDMRNIAVVVSDGINTGDVNTSVDSLRSRLSGSGIAIYALAVDSAEPDAIESFREFIQLSGGELFTFSPETCGTSMESLHQSVDAIWNVGIQVDPALTTSEPQSLVIQVGDFGTIEREVVIEQQIVDTTPPTITEWTMNTENDTLELFFSEAMADLKNPDHYQITGPDQSIVPVTVLESGEVYVLLSIPGLEHVPGWRADFVRLMDASPNRNLLEEKTLLLTPEIVAEPENPANPDIENPLSPFSFDFLMKYWPIAVGVLVLIIILILCLVILVIRKRKAASDKNKEEKNAQNKAEAPKTKRVWFRWLRGSSYVEETEYVDESYNPDNPQAGSEESGGKVSMSKGSAMPMGAVPMRDTSQVSGGSSSDASSSSDDDVESSTSVNGHKRKRGLFGLFGLFSSKPDIPNSIEEGDEESGVNVSAPLHNMKAPTRDGEAAESEEEYEVDKVSEHRKNPKVRRKVRRNWFFWKKKDIPVAEETTKEETVSTEADTADSTNTDDISEAAARKYIKPKKRWFWQRKKNEAPTAENTPAEEEKPSEEETAVDAEDEIDEKTAQKYIKPKKNWFKKNIIPVAKTAIPERPAESEEIASEWPDEEDLTPDWFGTEEKTAPEQPVEQMTAVPEQTIEKKPLADKSDKKDTPKDTPETIKTSINSGGFSLSGMSVNTRPSFFNFSIKPETKLKDLSYKTSTKTKKNVKMDKPLKTANKKNAYTAPSLSSPGKSKTYSSSKAKKINFTFTGDNQKKGR